MRKKASMRRRPSGGGSTRYHVSLSDKASGTVDAVCAAWLKANGTQITHSMVVDLALKQANVSTLVKQLKKELG